MAVTRRGHIFGAFVSSLLCVFMVVLAIANDSWVTATATTQNQVNDSLINYGLFRGELELNTLATASYSVLYMTCVSGSSACALSCKTEAAARQAEVIALAEGRTPSTACVAVTEVSSTASIISSPPVISFALYVSTLLLLALMLLTSVAAAGLTIINATMNPTEPCFGLPGCLWTNVATAVIGFAVMMTFGVYWAASGLSTHLAFSYVSVGPFTPDSSLGYCYWLLLVAIICSVINIVLFRVRAYLLERDPPAPVIKVEADSDGTVILY